MADDLDIITETPDPLAFAPTDDSLDAAPDGDRQLTTESDALDTGLNDSDLGADVAGDIGPKHP